MKTKTKLTISFIVLMIVLIFISSISLRNISVLGGKLDEVYANRYQKLMLAYDIRGSVNEVAKGVTNILTVQNAETLSKNESLLADKPKQAREYFDELKRIASTETELVMLNDVERSFTDYFQYAAEVKRLVAAGRGTEAVALREKVGVAEQENTVNLIDDLTAYHRSATDEAVRSASSANRSTRMIMIVTMMAGMLIGIGTMLWNTTGVTRSLNRLTDMIGDYARGMSDPVLRKRAETPDEFGTVAKAFFSLADTLERKTEAEQAYNKKMEEETWVKSNLASVSVALQESKELEQLGFLFMERVVPLVGAVYGGLYIREGYGQDNKLRLYGAYAPQDDTAFEQQFRMGEGLVGQCARSGQPIALADIPSNYLRIRSGLGGTPPRSLLLLPVAYQNQQLAVIELASLAPIDSKQRELLTDLAAGLGSLLNNLFGRLRIEELLRESQVLSEELQAQSEELISQQEELRQSNDQLEEQTRSLKKSEELLQSQQEELEQSNEELLKKTHLLEQQMRKTEQKNEQIERTKTALERQTVQLALSSKYKSEFLANMSHELRTPLNSLLILSQMLMDNKERNLTGKQIEFATTIHSSGGDLLKLIDEILDLSKIGAGKMSVVTEHVPFSDLLQTMRRSFGPMSQQRGLDFELTVEKDVPEGFYSDGHRVKQVLKNLLSNAFKFTHRGSVSLTVRNAQAAEAELDADGGRLIAFEVRDTGIGIPEEKQQLVFEAFQQVDGTTSRTYGGTGLGLAISQELAGLLGGKLLLESKEGEGSVFTLYLPEYHVAFQNGKDAQTDSDAKLGEQAVEAAMLAKQGRRALSEAAMSTASGLAAQRPLTPSGTNAGLVRAAASIEDDRDSIETEDRVVLIIEDDEPFARVLLDMARAHGFKGIVAMQGDIGLNEARRYKPDAILLDIMLPVMDGWSVLHHLKHDADTRHIPVHVVSVMEEVQQGLAMGAIAYLRKPAEKERLERLFVKMESFLAHDLKYVLVVEDDAAQRTGIIELVGGEDVIVKAVSSGAEAMRELETQHWDCMVLDLGLPDISGFELLDGIRRSEKLRELPIIIYTGRDLDKKDEIRLRQYAETIIIKDAKSPERLLDETTLFLHRVVADLPEEKRTVLRKLHSVETIFEGKSILIVDDDIRNVFALSSALEGYKMDIHIAENGREALEMLARHPDTQLILMDMMMPEMDGYETMRHIRAIPEYERLPMIAITAKAMKEDRDKCIEAGASDYISKPVNIDQLLSLMRVWLYQ
ncbi:response regulator [Paenibacillus rhizovicinus]|uniref:Circadian input-output histidine kinase CikA n=1 Tax=Paenibacillus rhizovicinus TaxID=2704463 RepID=A0A6C0NYQ1_9BACL|nr:response regulator [Paenibacillus rhizovicinus]QHW31374.1 response regulator [Paenibacillus rhizovicinus]